MNLIFLLLLFIFLYVIHDVKSWTTHNKLKPGNHKTEVLIISGPRILNWTPFPQLSSCRRLPQSAKNLGVMLNVFMTVAAQDIVNLTHTVNYEVGPVSSVLHLPLFAIHQNSCFCFCSFTDWSILIPCSLDALGTF